jgi:HAE1 family hydrophobic/amphiphilic exporter-1
MTIPEFSIKRRITVFMVILIVCIFGIIAFSRLGLDMLPELEYPVATLLTLFVIPVFYSLFDRIRES